MARKIIQFVIGFCIIVSGACVIGWLFEQTWLDKAVAVVIVGIALYVIVNASISVGKELFPDKKNNNHGAH